MAYLEVKKDGKVVKREQVTLDEAHSTCRVRIGSSRVHVALGEVKHVGEYEVALVNIPTGDIADEQNQEKAGAEFASKVTGGLREADILISSDDPHTTLLHPPRDAAGSDAGASYDSVESLLRDSGAPRYVEKETIGKGGMGEIVLCVERNTRWQVAMKRMLPTAAKHARSRARFVEEAQVTAQLEHPNIVPVHELEMADDGTIYFTMKLVKGRSLAEILKAARDGKEAPSLGELLQIFLKVCDGVAFAHSREVIHRDLKPANIMIGDFGEVLVMDWGLARILGRQDIQSDDFVKSSRQDLDQPELYTIVGKAMGSPAYMSPEQAAGDLDRIRPSSDIYSLGAILYEILTLKRPVTGDTAKAVLAKVGKEQITPPEQRAPERNIPRELSAIAMKCLSKSRRQRYQSVTGLQRDVSLFLEGRSVSAAPDTFAQAFVKLLKRNKALSTAVASAAVILITVVSIAFVRVTSAMRRAINERQAAQEARDKQRATALSASQELAERAVRAAEQARWLEADISVAAARKMLPDSPWGHYAAGMVAVARKHHKTARMQLTKALACDPAHMPSKAALSQIVALEGKLGEAAALLADPGKTKAWRPFRDAGDALYGQQRYRQAETAYARALELLGNPHHVLEEEKDWRTLIALGDALSAGEFYLGAKLAYERAGEQMEKAEGVPPEARHQLRWKLEKLEKLKGKLKAFDALKTELGNKKGNATAWVKCEGFYESIKKLPAAQQIERIKAKLKELHGQEPRGSYGTREGVLVDVGLTWTSSERDRTLFLQPLAGLPLTDFTCYGAVSDLSPLKGMRLKELRCDSAPVADLTPLKGMPLTHLDCQFTKVSDLRPLEGMPLTSLNCADTNVSDLTPLKGMPLTLLRCERTKVTDLSPLTGMKLEELRFTPKNITKGIEIVRDMTSIARIGRSYNLMDPQEFWKKYDAGEFNK